MPDRTSPQYRVELPAFEGPLGLLLHLIRQNEIDIAQIVFARTFNYDIGSGHVWA